MNSKASTPNAKGFYIWFDKKNKKEYYATPITLYKAKVHKSRNSKYSYVTYAESYLPKISPKRNKAGYIANSLNLKLVDLYNPYEERYGMFLINFLNARFDEWFHAYKDFFSIYSLELLDKTSRKLKMGYKDENDFRKVAKALFDSSKEELVNLQNKFRSCIDYMYNLNGNEDDKEFDPYIKFKAYALKTDMNKYTENTEIVFNSMSIFKDDFVNIKLNELTKSLDNGKINFQDSRKYTSTHLSNICFIVLDEIASNETSIKICKNCGRYFIPLNRHAEVYCDLTPYAVNSKKCRELGARTTYNKNIQGVEGLLIYRRTYQRRLMELSRNQDTTNEEKEMFDNWKKLAQAKIKEFKSKKITEDELNQWMKDNKDK